MKVETTYGHYKQWLAHKHQLNTHSSTNVDVIYDRLYGVGRLFVSYITNKPFSIKIKCSDDQMHDALRIFHQNTPLEMSRSLAYDHILERYLSLGEETHNVLLKYVDIESSHEKYNDHYNKTLYSLMTIVSKLCHSFEKLTSEMEKIQNSESKSYSNDFKITSQHEYGNIRNDYRKLVKYLNKQMVLDLEYAKQQLLSYLKLPHDKSYKPNKETKTVFLPNEQSFSRFRDLYNLLVQSVSEDLSGLWSKENKQNCECLRGLYETCHFIIA